MMTKEQHIGHWVDTADKDWITVEVLLAGGCYLHCLNWAHLMLETIAKAHWIKNHDENLPPRIHNIVWLLVESGVDLEEEKMAFLNRFNRFTLWAPPDYGNKLAKLCTAEYTELIIEEVKDIRTCLLKMLQ